MFGGSVQVLGIILIFLCSFVLTDRNLIEIKIEKKPLLNEIISKVFPSNNIIIYEDISRDFEYNQTTVRFNSSNFFPKKNIFGNIKLGLVLILKNDNLIELKEIFFKNYIYQKLLIIIQDNNNLPKILQELTSIRIFHEVYFIIIKNNTIKTLLWNPFYTQNNCGRNLHLQDDITPSKKILHNCIFNVTYIKTVPFVNNISHNNPGIFISMFNMIQEVSKIEINFQHMESFQEEFMKNGSIWKATKFLLEKKTDAIIGHTMMNDTNDYNFGPLIYKDKFILVVPKPPRIRTYRRLLKVFKYPVWLTFLTMILLMSIIYSEFVEYYKSNVDYFYVLLDLYRISIGWSINFLPKRSTLRILLTFYLLYSINMSTIYTGKLSEIFTLPAQGIQIANAESMYINNYYPNMSWYFERLAAIYERFNVESWRHHINIVSTPERELLKGIATVTNRTAMTFQSTIDTFPYDTPNHDNVITNLTKMSLFVTFLLRKFNFLNEIIYFWSMEVIEKGFVGKWWNDIIMENSNFSMILSGIPEYDGAVILSLKHYEEAFWFLIYGYGAGLLVFFLEFIAIRLEYRIFKMQLYSKF